MSGKKYDQEKPMVALVDPNWILEVAKVLTFGAQKYDEENWREGFKYKRLLSALQRHILAFSSGEDLDPETGLSHLSHASCCLMFLSWMSENRKDLDDRYKNEVVDKKENDMIEYFNDKERKIY